MNWLGLVAIMVSAITAIGFAAWFSVVKYRLLQEMNGLKKSEVEMVALRTRMEALEKRPDPTVEQYTNVLMKIEDLRTECRQNERDLRGAEESFNRWINKDNARRRGEKNASNAEPAKEPETPEARLAALVAEGKAVPLDASSLSNGHKHTTFGQPARR